MSHRQTPPADPGHSPRPAVWRRLSPLLAAAATAVLLGGCNLPTFGTFTPWTKQEHGAYNLYQSLTIAAMVVGAIVWGLIFWCVIRYRRRPHQAESGELPKQTRYNIKWEVIYTVTPILMVIGIFCYTVIAEDQVDNVAAKPNDVVNVTAFQWGWRFDYPIGGGKVISVLPKNAPTPSPNNAQTGEQAQSPPVTYPTMVLPVNQTTQINLVSNDVVHGFYVPQFDFSRYAQPGVTNTFDFTPTRTGVFRGRCSQFCGLYHTQMIFYVRVVSQATYRGWIRSHATALKGPVT